jgi:hypothetical protein
MVCHRGSSPVHVLFFAVCTFGAVVCESPYHDTHGYRYLPVTDAISGHEVLMIRFTIHRVNVNVGGSVYSGFCNFIGRQFANLSCCAPWHGIKKRLRASRDGCLVVGLIKFLRPTPHPFPCTPAGSMCP